MSVAPARPQESDLRFGPAEWALSGVISLVWGSSFLFIAIAIDHVATPVVPMARTFFGALALACIPSARRMVERSDIPRLLLLSFVWMGLPFLLYPMAEETTSTAITGMLNGGLPVVTVVVGAIWFRRMPSVFRMVSVLIGFSGIALISFSSVSGDEEGASADIRGIVLLLIALLCYGIAVNIAAPLQRKYGSLRLMLWVESFALLWSLPLGIPALFDSQFAWSALFALLALGAVGTGLAFAVYGVLLGRSGTVRGMIGTFFTPIVGVALGVLFRDEHIRWPAIVGMLIVVAGAVMTSRPDHN
jgi:drug/metabolite transporter (DMT)-like permease